MNKTAKLSSLFLLCLLILAVYSAPCFAQGAPRLDELEAKRLASQDPNVVLVLGKHPELERFASFDSDKRRWTVTWKNPHNSRTIISVVVDDETGMTVSSDIKGEAWFDALPTTTEKDAIEAARADPRVAEELAGHADVTESASLGSDSVWTVSFFAGSEEVAEVLVGDAAGNVQEVRIGPQIAWQMARGYKGAFGRIINEPYIWLPLCLLFLAPFVDWRRPWRLLHLDLLMLLAFSVSHYFFNQGDIFTSVPLAYPPLVYLFLRLAWIGWRRNRKPAGELPGLMQPAEPAVETGVERPPRLNFGPTILAIGIGLLLVFRIVLNVADSNVVDVGYSGVIGAHNILEGKAPYGNMPSDNGNGDTYGPFNYLVYVPFEAIMPWSGTWDDLPAAHATAILFDLVAVAGMYMAGRVMARGRPFAHNLGLAFAWGWAAYPYTTFVLNCNVNDSIVAALIIWGFVLIQKAPLAGALLGFATQVKFFPAMLGPLWASFPRAMRGWGRRLAFVAGFLLAVASTLPVIFLGDGSLSVFWEKTVKWQIERDSPFSIWGQYPDQLAAAQRAGEYLLVSAAVGTYFWPLRKTMVQVAAISAALLVGFQVVQTHWFYLYIPWFFPLALIAFLTVSSRTRNRSLEITRSYIGQNI